MAVHNLNPHCIFLISKESGKLSAKIGDFELYLFEYPFNVMQRPHYCPIEFFEVETSSEKSDIYSFGMCLVFMCTLEEPYSECTNVYQIYRRLNLKEMPDCLNNCVDILGLEFISLCCEKDPIDRPSARLLLVHSYLNDILHEFCVSTPIHSVHALASPSSTPNLSTSASSWSSTSSFEDDVCCSGSNLLYYYKRPKLFDSSNYNSNNREYISNNNNLFLPDININSDKLKHVNITQPLSALQSQQQLQIMFGKKNSPKERLAPLRMMSRSKSMITIASLSDEARGPIRPGHRRQKSIPVMTHMNESDAGFHTLSEKFYGTIPTESEDACTDRPISRSSNIKLSSPNETLSSPGDAEVMIPIPSSPPENSHTSGTITDTAYHSPFVLVEPHHHKYENNNTSGNEGLIPLTSYKDASSSETNASSNKLFDPMNLLKKNYSSSGDSNNELNRSNSCNSVDIRLYIPNNNNNNNSNSPINTDNNNSSSNNNNNYSSSNTDIEVKQDAIINNSNNYIPLVDDSTKKVENEEQHQQITSSSRHKRSNSILKEVKFSFNLKEDTIEGVCDELSHVFPLSSREIKKIEQKIVDSLQRAGYIPLLN